MVLDADVRNPDHGRPPLLQISQLCCYGTTKHSRVMAGTSIDMSRQARLGAGIAQEDVFSKWGHSPDSGNLHQAENGIRVLPYKNPERLLESLGLKAVIVRPGLDGWNAISRKRCLEDMLIEIGEPGRGYVKKGRK